MTLSARTGQLWMAGALALVAAGFTLAPSARAAEALGGVSGEVTEAGSRTPVQGIEVCAITTNFELLGEEESEYEHAFGCAQTGASGEYEVTGLRPESYYVEFLPTGSLNYIAQLYDGSYELSEATSVAVTTEKTTAGIDAELSPGAEIAGVVTSAATGAPVEKAIVCALRTSAKGQVEASGCGISEAGGAYTVRGLPSGSYKLGFEARGFEVMYYNGKTSEAEAELVQVTAPNLTAGINEALKPGGPSSAPSSALPGSPSAEQRSGAVSGVLGTSSSSAPSSTLSLVGKRITAARGRDALVKLDCTGAESCRAKLTLRVKTEVRIKGRRTSHTVMIGTSAVVSIDQGKKATARIELNSDGRKLLRERGRLEVELEIVTTGHQEQDERIVLIEREAARHD